MGSLSTPQRNNEPAAGMAAWEIPERPTHAVQFYGSDDCLLEDLSRFVGAALGSGDAVVIIATPAHRDGLARRLQARGFDVERAAQLGHYTALDAAATLATLMIDGRISAARFAEVIGGLISQISLCGEGRRRVSAFGEMVALLWAQGKADAVLRLEELWNDLAISSNLSLLCAYPMSGFDREDHGDSFLKICAEHSHVIPMESYTSLASDDQRHRSITHLQQKAVALENEMAERKQVEEALRRTKAELETLVEQRTVALRQLSSRLLSLQDSERRRIARELHDSLGQCLVGLKLNVEMLRSAPGREDLWSEVESLTQQCITEVRTLSYLLHPPTMDAAGFASAARWYVEGFAQRSGLQVSLDAPHDLGRLPDSVELTLFRVLQEALTNVHRHSGASAAQVVIREDDRQLRLEIKDNGCGMPKKLLAHFEATGAGMGVGLAGIRERAWELGGRLAVESDGDGTLLRVTIPVSSAAERQP